jgi:hypothetical protein
MPALSAFRPFRTSPGGEDLAMTDVIGALDRPLLDKM